MDLKLMKDFEELEGIDDMHNQEIVIEDDEDDSSLRPANAYALSSADLYYEVYLYIYFNLINIFMAENLKYLNLKDGKKKLEIYRVSRNR